MKPERIEEIEDYWGLPDDTNWKELHPDYDGARNQIAELIASLRAAQRSNAELKRRMETIRFVVVDAELKLKGIGDLADIYEFEGK